MKNTDQQLEALHDIRKMMQDSSKFLSLSGLSGVFAGVYALVGAYFGTLVMAEYVFGHLMEEESEQAYQNLLLKICLICAGVLVLSIVTALFFSSRKAKRNGQKLFDHTSKKLLVNMLVPLFTGGLFCLALVLHGNGFVLMVSPAMLLFYGLALINSSKFTLHDIRYLGYLEVILGLIAAFLPGYGLLFWAIGFGVLHIVYGGIMWFKYDRAK
jgi:hypothetical protein